MPGLVRVGVGTGVRAVGRLAVGTFVPLGTFVLLVGSLLLGTIVRLVSLLAVRNLAITV